LFEKFNSPTVDTLTSQSNCNAHDIKAHQALADALEKVM